MSDQPVISVVIPLKNEEESVPDLAAEVAQVLDAAGLDWECWWVNDASTDATLAVLRRLRAANPRHRWIDMAASFGQSAALATGFRHARGEFISTLDGDGQNDPHDIPRLLEKLRAENADFVIGVRTKRHDNWVRRLSSRIANGVRNWLTHEKVSDTGCAMRVFRRSVTDGIPVWKGMHRFYPTMVRLKGGRIAEMPVNHRPRLKGQAKYGIGNRVWVGIYDIFAVRWMASRMTWPRVTKTDADA